MTESRITQTVIKILPAKVSAAFNATRRLLIARAHTFLQKSMIHLNILGASFGDIKQVPSLRVFENRVLRRIFGPKREETTWKTQA